VLALGHAFVMKGIMTSAPRSAREPSGPERHGVASAAPVLRVVAPVWGLLLMGCVGATDGDGPSGEAAFGMGPAPTAVVHYVRPLVVVGEHELRDTFGAPREGGRRHRGIDILAPRGTPVLAALDGRVVGVQDGGAGGRALHLLDRSGSYVMYYAHLDRYADGVRRGRSVRQGDVLGYVGSTGNAHGGSPHLHFEVAAVRDPHRWWEHEPLNAYVFLTSGLDALPGAVALEPGKPVTATGAPSDPAR
jgi:murein DD-endopeptidase MepM/ murein hydrolase activator NlpD